MPTRFPISNIDYSEFQPCDSLHELLASNENSIHTLEESQSIHTPPPWDYGGQIDTFLNNPRGDDDHLPESWWEQPIITPAAYAVNLKNGIAIGGRINRRNIPEELFQVRHEGGQLLLTEQKELIPDSYLRYRSLPIDLLEVISEDEIYLRDPLNSVRKETGRFLLLGNFSMNHFGHMIIESLARLWPVLEIDLSQIQLVVYQSELNSDAIQYLKALNIAVDQIYFLTKPTQFENLIVPSSPYLLHRQNSPLMDRIWRKIGRSFPPAEHSPERIYISRSRFKKWRNLENEEAVEQLFSSRGFEIVHPQELPLNQQISLIRAADHVAGCIGSGSYSCAFSEKKLKQLILAPHTFVYRDDPLITYFKGGHTDFFLSNETIQDERGPRYPDWNLPIDKLDHAVEAWLES